MRIVVASDSHGAKSRLFEIVEKQMENTDLFIFLGDGEKDFDDIISLYPHLNYERVSGNGDWYSEYPDYKEVFVQKKRIFFSHGHPFHVKNGYHEIINEAKRRNADICLFGHTHIQYANYDDGLYIMNPGCALAGEYGMIDIVREGIILIPCKLQ